MSTIEGGALVSSEGEAKLAEKLRFHGIARLPDGTRDVDIAGGKFNMPGVNARIGLSQIARLGGFIARRRRLPARYFANVHADPQCVPPAHAYADDGEGHSCNMFCMVLPLERLDITGRQFIDSMHARGIGVGFSYEALHLTTLFQGFGNREGDFPNAERIARETITLPLCPAMSTDDVDRLCKTIAKVFAHDRG